jgi:antitoxin component YwqK of YwqJK toxin-antitoxin module
MVSVALCGCLLGAWACRDFMPGTLRRDGNGFAHGTGTERFFYASGPIREEDDYRNGVAVRSRWYRPDGSLVASSEFDVQNGGLGYFLREDGSVRETVHYRYSTHNRQYLADGVATFYNPDGSINRTSEFRGGIELKPGQH